MTELEISLLGCEARAPSRGGSETLFTPGPTDGACHKKKLLWRRRLFLTQARKL